ncbi:MAG: stage II sporulation protein M [bacterium]|nr:stage II sporulation protein M [bacterium]
MGRKRNLRMPRRRLAPKQQLLLLFLLGVLAGSVYGNWMGCESALGELSFSVSLSATEKKELFHLVLGQRLAESLLLWGLGMSAAAVWAVGLLVAGCGFVSAFWMCACVMQKGTMGFFFFWAMLLPQYLLYIPLWYHMALSSYQSTKRMRTRDLVLALLLTTVASVAEAFCNPVLMKLLFQIFPEKINF